MKTMALILIIVFASQHSHCGDGGEKQFGKLSAEAWQKVFSKNPSGFSKRPLVPGVTVMKADPATVQAFHRFFPSLSEVVYHGCATKIEAELGAQLPLENLKDDGVVILEPTIIGQTPAKHEGVLMTWTRLLSDGKTQEVHHQEIPARTCVTSEIVKRMLSYDRSKFEKLVRSNPSKMPDLASYIKNIEGTERAQARAQRYAPEEPSTLSRGRMPASVKGP